MHQAVDELKALQACHQLHSTPMIQLPCKETGQGNSSIHGSCWYCVMLGMQPSCHAVLKGVNTKCSEYIWSVQKSKAWAFKSVGQGFKSLSLSSQVLLGWSHNLSVSSLVKQSYSKCSTSRGMIVRTTKGKLFYVQHGPTLLLQSIIARLHRISHPQKRDRCDQQPTGQKTPYCGSVALIFAFL